MKYLPGLANMKDKVEQSLENNEIFKIQKIYNLINDSERKNFS